MQTKRMNNNSAVQHDISAKSMVYSNELGLFMKRRGYLWLYGPNSLMEVVRFELGVNGYLEL